MAFPIIQLNHLLLGLRIMFLFFDILANRILAAGRLTLLCLGQGAAIGCALTSNHLVVVYFARFQFRRFLGR